ARRHGRRYWIVILLVARRRPTRAHGRLKRRDGKDHGERQEKEEHWRRQKRWRQAQAIYHRQGEGSRPAETCDAANRQAASCQVSQRSRGESRHQKAGGEARR